MDANEDQCSICWDSYKLPKLLQCRHTFCCSCLKSYVRKSRGRSELNCPLCRQSWWIPEDGVTGFMNNYFMEDTEITAKVEPAECDICRQLFVLRECTHCAQKMCSNCSLSHKEALKLAGESGYERVFDKKQTDNLDSDSYSSGDNDSDSDDEARRRHRRRNSEVNIPFSLYLSLQPIRTKFKVDQVSVITMDRNVSEIAHSFINCIHPVSDSECLVVPFAGPEIFRYNFQGEVKSRVPLHSGIITSVLQRPDGSLLVSLWSDRSIICLNGDIILGFYNTGEYSPHAMALFPDGRVVFVGPNASQRKEGVEKVDSVKQFGTCQIMSKDGTFIREIKQNSEGPLFENPSSVAISPTAGTIAVADRGKKCVYLFLQDGTLIAKYTGSRHRFGLLSDIPNFMPLNICFDRNGYLLIADAAHRILHVINEMGDFIGLLASHDGDFGQPFSVAVDFSGRIWIGDEADRTVKIFEIENFINCFAAENN